MASAAATTPAITPMPLNGYRIFPFPARQALLDFVAEGKGILVALNGEKLVQADPDLQRIVNANIGYPDGVGAVWALRRKGVAATKIPGVELWLDIVEQTVPERSIYLVGGSEEVVQETVRRLRERFPGVSVAGYRNGYMNEEERQALAREIEATRPDYVFVAMGTPRQELLMERLLAAHSALYMGLGGSFDVLVGKRRRAPRLFRRLGLEWLYRLMREPWRLRRQLKLVKFLYLLLRNKL